MLSNVVLFSDESSKVENQACTHISALSWISFTFAGGMDGETEMDTYSLQCTGQLTNENSLTAQGSPFNAPWWPKWLPSFT